MSKTGKGDKLDTGSVGSQHPVPENIPHLSSPGSHQGSAAGLNGGPGHQHHPSISAGVSGHQIGGSVSGGNVGSPVKESNLFKTELSTADDAETGVVDGAAGQQQPISENANAQAIPIRR